jgi:hypothetical protein
MNAKTDSALRSLDAAGATLTAGQRDRAAATLERIVETPPPTAAVRSAAPTRVRHSRRRLALVAAAALALTVGAVVVVQGNGDDDAYASWTAAPTTVTGRELHAVASACRDQLEGHIDRHQATIVLAERRGDHVALLFHTDNPDISAACLARNPQGSTDVDNVNTGVGGSSGPAEEAPAKSFTQGTISQFGGAFTASITDGAVGDQVAGVTVHAGAFTVQASVRNGRYVAWWPGAAFPTDPPAPNGKERTKEIITYDLTLADGTVIRNAPPTRPS